MKISKYTYTIVGTLLLLLVLIVLFFSFRFLYQVRQKAYLVETELIEAKTVKFDMPGYEQILPKIKAR